MQTTNDTNAKYEVGKIYKREDGTYFKMVSSGIRIYGSYEELQKTTLESVKKEMGGIEDMPLTMSYRRDESK